MRLPGTHLRRDKEVDKAATQEYSQADIENQAAQRIRAADLSVLTHQPLITDNSISPVDRKYTDYYKFNNAKNIEFSSK